MTHSTFRQPLPAQPAAADVRRAIGRPRSQPTAFEIVGPAPAGSLASTGADMAQFMIAHLQNGEYTAAHPQARDRADDARQRR